jgi:hypothetical protein
MKRIPVAIVSALLAAAVMFCAPAGHARSASADQKTCQTKSVAKEKKAEHKVIVYYFHNKVRCSNCIKFENYTNELMQSNFADAIKQGRLQWKVVDWEKSGNEHFLKDYGLYTKAVVVVDTKNGKQTRYKNPEGIWQLVNDKSGFQEYVAGEVNSFLGGK